ncbi:HxlR family transcriptional regulator [Natrialba taiwanensis DSM 12281]|uniref:HxlR family transcriptional regulator n=2 Tax=Natrialba taiwanensis TaxID=160846 RepID=M0A306_9EURY|nr:HxlR family transcriptional regulator [Natrialba taiwanensis DSM 12281]
MGKAHTIAILHEFAVEPEPWRFNELKDRLNISPNTLSERLSELVDAELVARHPYNEIPPRVEYEATPKARELESVFEDFHDWMLRHEH